MTMIKLRSNFLIIYLYFFFITFKNFVNKVGTGVIYISAIYLQRVLGMSCAWNSLGVDVNMSERYPETDLVNSDIDRVYLLISALRTALNLNLVSNFYRYNFVVLILVWIIYIIIYFISHSLSFIKNQLQSITEKDFFEKIYQKWYWRCYLHFMVYTYLCNNCIKIKRLFQSVWISHRNDYSDERIPQ